MSDCSKHKKEVGGISDMRVLAEMIGDLHYEILIDFFDELSYKLYQDSLKNAKAGKEKLAEHLDKASNGIIEAHAHIKKAWQISKPFMENKTTK